MKADDARVAYQEEKEKFGNILEEHTRLLSQYRIKKSVEAIVDSEMTRTKTAYKRVKQNKTRIKQSSDSISTLVIYHNMFVFFNN